MAQTILEDSGGTVVEDLPPEMTNDLRFPVSKSPSIRREPRLGEDNLRMLYRTSISPPPRTSSNDPGSLGPTTPNLPPTPPNVEDEKQEEPEEPSLMAEANHARSQLATPATPVNQHSPPTPDNTPPRGFHNKVRPLLGAQPSFASTRAESFKTAPEEMPSDADTDFPHAISKSERPLQPSPIIPFKNVEHYKPSPLARAISPADIPLPSPDMPSIQPSSPTVPADLDNVPHDRAMSNPDPDIELDRSQAGQRNSQNLTPKQNRLDEAKVLNSPVISKKEGATHGASLRERLEEARHHPPSPSMDKFATIIGWNNSVRTPERNKRWSNGSTTSTVEAFLIPVETPQSQRRRSTLRHVSKTASLRSASSPFPETGWTLPMQPLVASPHHLVHKKARLSNQQRLSFSSEISQPISQKSYPPQVKVEVIKVAVIPERSSSLNRDTNSSTGHSRSASAQTTSTPRSRRVSDSHAQPKSSHANSEASERGRSRKYPPQTPMYIPPRSSSLSAPTSRNTSRAPSITSDDLRIERKRAEKDLRTTLDRMESDRLVASLQSLSMKSSTTPASNRLTEATQQTKAPEAELESIGSGINIAIFPEQLIPGTAEWAALRPPSIHGTPFSRPSFASASPEINEAKAVNLFVHNNHSVQLIEPFPIHESSAVILTRKKQNPPTESGHRKVQIELPGSVHQDIQPSRQAPPQVHLIPSTPQEESDRQLSQGWSPSKRWTSLRRPTRPGRVDSFGKSLVRNLSLKNAKNKKADQDLDSSLHPFWRPRPFWEDEQPVRAQDQTVHQLVTVNNSLGMPQERQVVAGPVSLVQRMAERRRTKRELVKKASYHSLQRLRTGRKLYRIPGLGLHLQFMSLKDLQERMSRDRQRREEQRREKRRAELRKSIGPNVISTGDSRFPATMVSGSEVPQDNTSPPSFPVLRHGVSHGTNNSMHTITIGKAF